MDNQTQEALKMAIEAMEASKEAWHEIGIYDAMYDNLVSSIQTCKEALEQPMQRSRFLGAIDLTSTAPLTEKERSMLMKESMALLLEAGELGGLGMLLNRYEETVREAEQNE